MSRIRTVVAAGIVGVAALAGPVRGDEPEVPGEPAVPGAVETLTTMELGRAHAEQFFARPWLIAATVGIGLEPHDRGLTAGDSATVELTRSPIAFQLGGQALWRGLVGAAIGL